MPIFVDPKTGERFENYAPDAAERAAEFGFVTPEKSVNTVRYSQYYFCASIELS